MQANEWLYDMLTGAAVRVAADTRLGVLLKQS
jgi:hypothetical protein